MTQPQPAGVVASDAGQEGPQQDSGGFLLVTSSCGRRVGAVVAITCSVFWLWDSQGAKIAQLELLMVLKVLLTFPAVFAGRLGAWFVNNLGILMTLVRARSNSEELETMGHSVHSLVGQTLSATSASVIITSPERVSYSFQLRPALLVAMWFSNFEALWAGRINNSSLQSAAGVLLNSLVRCWGKLGCCHSCPSDMFACPLQL